MPAQKGGDVQIIQDRDGNIHDLCIVVTRTGVCVIWKVDDDGNTLMGCITISMIGVDQKDGVIQFSRICQIVIDILDVFIETQQSIFIVINIPFISFRGRVTGKDFICRLSFFNLLRIGHTDLIRWSSFSFDIYIVVFL